MRRILIPVLVLIVLIFPACTKSKNNTSATDNTSKTGDNSSESKQEITANEVSVGYANAPPRIYFDSESKKPAGIVYDMIENYIAPEMGIKFDWHNESITVARQIEMLKTRKGKFAVAILTYNPSRESFVTYPAKPYSQIKSALGIKKDNPLNKITTIDDITGLTIGYVKEAVMTPFLKNNLDKLTIEYSASPNFDTQGCKMVILDRLDAVYNPDKDALLTTIKGLEDGDMLKVIDLPDPPIDIYFAFSKDMDDIVEKYNKAMDKLDGQALYQRLMAEYLSN